MNETSGEGKPKPKQKYQPLLALRHEMEDLVSRFLGEGDLWLSDRVPVAIDLSESSETVDLSIDLPGIDPNDVDLRLSGTMLTISGKRILEHDEEGRAYHRVERRSGSFSRTVTLPCAVVEEKVKADYRDGVLSVRLPKSEESIGRKIKIKRGKEDSNSKGQ